MNSEKGVKQCKSNLGASDDDDLDQKKNKAHLPYKTQQERHNRYCALFGFSQGNIIAFRAYYARTYVITYDVGMYVQWTFA